MFIITNALTSARFVLHISVFVTLLLGLSPVFSAPPAESIPIPETIDGAETIDAEQLIKLAQSLDKLVVIDSRVTEDRTMGYIEESISLSNIDTNCQSLSRKLWNKETPVVFYCNGPKCGRSVLATKIAVQCGYQSVHWFKGGFAEWELKDYPYVID